MDIWNFWDIDWGSDEAKGDRHLKDYFVTIPEYQDIVNGRYRYIIGRKGSGKTAICEKIRLDAEEDPLAFSSSLSLRSFPISIIRDLRDKSFRDKSQFVPVWSFLITVELAKLVLQDNGCGPQLLVDEIKRFLSQNFLANNFGFAETVQLLKKNQAKVMVQQSWLSFGGQRETAATATVPLHYQQATAALTEKLLQVKSESKFYLFMDELDEGYRAGDSGLRLILLALLRAVEDFAIAFNDKEISVNPIVALRSDIFDRLEDNDLNKLDDSTLRIRWRSIERPVYFLKDILNARITSSLPQLKNVPPWETVVEDQPYNLPKKVKSCWSYIANSTFERPRDIIKFMKMCKMEIGNGRLKFSHIQNAEKSYSKWFYNELRDEIYSHLPVWKESLDCLTRIGRGMLTSKDFINALKEDKKISRWLKDDGKEVEHIVETLFDFSVLGNFDGKRWLFSYKENAGLAWNPSMKLIVHFGFKSQAK